MKNKKSLKLIVGILMLLSFVLFAKNVWADDDREIVHDVNITSNMGVPTYGGEVKSYYSYTTIEGTEAHMEPHMGMWFKRNGDVWEKYNGTVFVEGTYYFSNQIRVDGELGTGYRLDNSTSLMVDGVVWTRRHDVTIADTYSYTYYDSPEYVVYLPLVSPTLNYTASNYTMTLTWNHQDGATSYEVYRSIDNKSFTKITTTANEKYVDSKLTYGTTYYYKVKAIDANSNSVFSNVISKKIVPNTVKNLKISSAYTTIANLKWDKVSTTGYQVYRSTDNKTWTKVASIKSNSTLTYKDTGLTANTRYYYKVRAYKLVDGKYTYGSYSNVVTVKTAPKTPTASISLWNYQTLSIKVNAATGASKFLIYRSTTKDGTYTKVGELTAAGTFKNAGLTPGKTYYYKVKACNSYNRCSGYSGVVSKKPVPGTVKGLQATPGPIYVKLSWNSVLGATGYEVYRSTSKTGTYTKLTTVTNTTYTNRKLSENKTYYYKVRAYRIVNGTKVYGSYSNILTTKTTTMTSGQRNALKEAKSYLSVMPFSYKGLIEQLEYENYTHSQAVFAADNCGANWKDQALKEAKSYLSVMPFSYQGLIEQLEFEKYTHDQAVYAANNVGANWKEQAYKSALRYLDLMSFSREELINQLEFEKYTHAQAVYAVDKVGLY